MAAHPRARATRFSLARTMRARLHRWGPTVAGTEPKLGIHIAEDRNSVTLGVVPASGGAGSATFSLEQLTSIIQGLGLARQHMAFGRPSPALDGQEVHAAFGADWYVAPELRSGGSALLFEHLEISAPTEPT